ncbi:MAG TPA: hypothetical protein VFF67_00405 [Thermoplasmata archaeon]|nr:hypothetical protein [Thermoplasmata archaeon]
MRGGVVAVGLILLILGFILAYVPIPGQTVPSTTVTQSTPAILSVSSPPFLFFTSTLPFSLSWTSSAAITVYVYACGSDSQCAAVTPNVTSPVVTGSGSSGSVSFTAQKGQYYEIYGKSSAATWTATFSATYAVPFVGGSLGFFLLILGIVVLIVGLVLKKKQPPSPAPTTVPAPAPPAGS